MEKETIKNFLSLFVNTLQVDGIYQEEKFKEFVEQNPEMKEVIINSIPEKVIHLKFMQNKETALNAVRNNGKCYNVLSQNLKKDLEIAKIAFGNGADLDMAPNNIKQNSEICLIALEHGNRFGLIDECLKENKDFLLKAFKKNHDISFKDINDLNKGLFKDIDFVKNLLSQENVFISRRMFEIIGSQVSVVDNELKTLLIEKDEDSIINCRQLLYSLNKEDVFVILNKNGSTFKYLNESFKKDKDIYSLAIKKNIRNVDCLDLDLKNKKEIWVYALNNGYRTTDFFENSEISKEIKNDKDLLKIMLSKNPEIIYRKEFDQNLLKDKELMIEMCKDSSENFRYLSKELKYDKDFLIQLVVVANKNFFVWIPKKFKEEFKDWNNLKKFAIAIQKNNNLLDKLNDKFANKLNNIKKI